MTSLRVADIVQDSIVDGPGLRLAVFVQGCKHDCPKCHNPQTHNIFGGKTIDISEIVSALKKNQLLSGLTLSGGEPLLQPQPLLELCTIVKGMGKNIWLYSGYTWKEIQQLCLHNLTIRKLLDNIDVLVEGRYIDELRDLNLEFRGSSNQRIIEFKNYIPKFNLA